MSHLCRISREFVAFHNDLLAFHNEFFRNIHNEKLRFSCQIHLITIISHKFLRSNHTRSYTITTIIIIYVSLIFGWIVHFWMTVIGLEIYTSTGVGSYLEIAHHLAICLSNTIFIWTDISPYKSHCTLIVHFQHAHLPPKKMILRSIQLICANKIGVIVLGFGFVYLFFKGFTLLPCSQ